MKEQRATLEVIAPSVDEAIEKGLADLGLKTDDVTVEILDKGGRGLFKMGSRQARVRLTIKEPQPSDSQPTAPVADEEAEKEYGEAPVRYDEENTLEVARETVKELLDKMMVRATVEARFGESDEPHRHRPIIVDVSGDDLSILIGRRAETLNALQYITRLIVGKELGHAVLINVDVEGYRVRRERTLRRLARRMADQAVKTGRRQSLEPMPANERRIVHIELKDHPKVTTESMGSDPRRKVTIIPTIE